MSKLNLREEMKRSHLIQRLNKPLGFINPFGGNPGLSGDAMDTLMPIFSFDYMGAAEFEWGAVPEALSFIASQAAVRNLTDGEHRGVYFIAPTQYVAGVKRLIDQLIADERAAGLLEYCGLAKALKGEGSDTVGWLELDNGFFLFTDKAMFDKTKVLFAGFAA